MFTQCNFRWPTRGLHKNVRVATATVESALNFDRVINSIRDRGRHRQREHIPTAATDAASTE